MLHREVCSLPTAQDQTVTLDSMPDRVQDMPRTDRVMGLVMDRAMGRAMDRAMDKIPLTAHPELEWERRAMTNLDFSQEWGGQPVAQEWEATVDPYKKIQWTPKPL